MTKSLSRWFNRRPRTWASCWLRLEMLESRETPTLTNSPWPDPQHLSLSFAPDGTSLLGEPSVLASTFDQSHPGTWRQEILRAVQSWVIHAHLNVGLRSDDGSPFGTPGRLQGDARFGDIRLGAAPMTSETIATAVRPGRTTPGTWAGDIIFNSATDYNAQSLDLFTIALHEVGHALGLRDTTQPDSVMNSRYQRIVAGPTSRDISELQKIYGARPHDVHEGVAGNNSLRTATRLDTTPREDFHPDLPLIVYGDITCRTDVDFFTIRPAPGYNGPMTFRVQTAGLSLLNPSLTLYDSSGQILARSASTNLGGGVVHLTLSDVNPASTYYVRIQGATPDVFGIGRYSLAVIHGELPNGNGMDDDDDDSDWSLDQLQAIMTGPFETLRGRELQALVADPNHRIGSDDDDDDDLDHAVPVATAHGYASNTHFVVLGSLSDSADVDVYQITSPGRFQGDLGVLTATAWGIDGQPTIAPIRLLDANRQELTGTILANGDGSFTIQATGIVPNSTYFVQIGPGDTTLVGNYELILDFGNRTADIMEFATGSLTTAQPVSEYDLFVAKTQIFHVLLEARGGSVSVTLCDEAGRVVTQLHAQDGQVGSGSGWALTPGRYRVRIESTEPATYRLYGMSIYDWIGPIAGNPATDPKYSDPSNPNQHVYPTPTGPITTVSPFLWSLRLF